MTHRDAKLTEAERPGDPAGLTRPQIAVEDLHYRVPGKEILHGVNLSVQKGQILSVMGMSGCGKTSLLHCIGGLLTPSEGSIWIGEAQIVGMRESALYRVRERMGMVFQYAALFDSLNVFENVAFGLKRRRKMSKSEIKDIVAQKLATVGLPDTESLFPSELSGGMAKRVGLARAIALEPEILLYDEPTSGLDPVVARVVDDLIVEMRDKLGVTSIIVSHNLPSVFRISDQIAMLHQGRVLAVGKPDDIRSSPDPVVQQFIQGQSHGPIEVARI